MNNIDKVVVIQNRTSEDTNPYVNPGELVLMIDKGTQTVRHMMVL